MNPFLSAPCGGAGHTAEPHHHLPQATHPRLTAVHGGLTTAATSAALSHSHDPGT